MISVQLAGYLGNQLWQYVVCRTVAEKLGYEYHIPRNFIGSDIFECDLGVSDKIVNTVFPTENAWQSDQKYDENIFNVPDYTELQGHFQTEKYILHNKEEVLRWFKFKADHSDSQKFLEEDTCVIHFRGGDYKNISKWILPTDYYTHAQNYVKSINPNVKFIVVTDDAHEARGRFGCPVYSSELASDFYMLCHAKYLIMSNSSFSWWGAYLNKISNLFIAPKYWLLHKDNSDIWFPADAITSNFTYIDIDGKVYSSDECVREFDSSINYTNKRWSF
jgi:hypothetical protein